MGTNVVGPALIGIAAFLWATDAIFRLPTVHTMDPTQIVLWEHLVSVLVLGPWILLRWRKQVVSLSKGEWLAALAVGAGGSALATVYFTASFKYINPSIAILLQKIQPILVVLLAWAFLREKPGKGFAIWALVALAAATVLTFPDLDFSFLSNDLDLRSRGVAYSLAAAGIWAASTIAGKFLLQKTPTSVATFWRFGFGLVMLLVLIALSETRLDVAALSQGTTLQFVLYMSLIPGLFAMMAYYGGLKRTPASVVTFVELVYPVAAVVLNTIFLKSPLTLVQIVAGAVLIGAVTMISSSSEA